MIYHRSFYDHLLNRLRFEHYTVPLEPFLGILDQSHCENDKARPEKQARVKDFQKAHELYFSARYHYL